MLSALASYAASAALSVIIVIAPPGDETAGSTPAQTSPPGVPAVENESAAGTPTLGPCTMEVQDAAALEKALAEAVPGSHICLSGDVSSTRLTVERGGEPGRPIAISGGGNTIVKGISVEASDVVVDGFQALNATAPGMSLTGDRITASNNLIREPTGGDHDGVRFFGNHIQILHNTITDVSAGGTGAHADCMQTFTSGRPSSEHVVISGNSCENIDNICLMAEGPGDKGDGGGGDGTSANWMISNNYCEFGAAQGLMIEAVQNVTITNNEFVGQADKAIGLDIGATGAKVAANKLVGIKAAVGMSEDSREGYQGPEPQGGP